MKIKVEIFGDDETEEEVISNEALAKLFKNKSIEEYKISLKNENKNKQIEALKGLSVLTLYGNKGAVKLMNEYFKSLPSPEALDEVHHKVKVLRIVSNDEINSEIVEALVKDLKETKSNQITRQWITAILKIMDENIDNEIVRESLQKLPFKKFSYKLRKRIEDIIYGNDYNLF